MRYAVTSQNQVIEAQNLLLQTSAQKVELIEIEFGTGKILNVYIDSQYLHVILHTHRAIWKERDMFTAENRLMKHTLSILKLLEAVQLPQSVAVIHCRGHQKGVQS